MKAEMMTDSEVVQSCLEGRLESYRTIMDKYKAHAMGLALHVLLNYQDAEDACQEAFLKAYSNLRKFDSAKSFKNWFSALLFNHCLDQLRKKKRFDFFINRYKKEEKARTVTEPSGPGPFDMLDSGFLRRLTPGERTSLYLWAQEGYSGAEIASALDCAPSTAHVYLFKARAKLKSWLKENQHAAS